MGSQYQDDEILALAVKAGDMAAYETLVRRYQGKVYAVAYRITLNREDALDATQEALLKVFRKIGQWEPTVGFLPWLMRLTANQAIDIVRVRKRRPAQALDEALLQQVEDQANPSVASDRGARGAEIATHVNRALEGLSPTQRAVFGMRHYEGLQLSEIADALGCSTGSVKVHLFRALKKMQKALGEFYQDQK
jgi:RNA polymerase sigma-70 factor (ECF subfamily)